MSDFLSQAEPAATRQLSAPARELLQVLGSSAGYVACDGKDRAVAHALEKMGLADWKGSSWGSQFWCITDAGRAALQPGGAER